MKRISILSTFVLGMLSGFSSFAQVDYSVGTGTATNSGTTYPTPYGDYYEGSRAQFLFRASELNALGMGAGNISALKWFVTALNTTSTPVHENWELKIGTTTATALSAWLTGLTTVVSSANYTPVLGVNTHTFSTPFFWNGTDNIVVEVCHGNPGNATGTWFTNNASVAYTEMSYNASRTYRADNGGNLCSSTSNSSLNPTYRPNITFVHTPTVSCATPPAITTSLASSATICNGSAVNLSLTGHIHRSGQTYQLQSSTSATGTFTNVGASASTWNQTQSPTSTIFYRTAITCGTSTAYSTPVQVTVNNPLPAGTYTINPSAPASATNFTNFASVVSALGCGIGGPVTFNISSGTYTSQFSIPQLPGTAANSRLTFQSATGNAADVTVQFTSTGTTDNYVVKLDEASYVTLKNITIKNNGATYARAIEITGAASNDSIAGCVLTGPTVTANSVNNAKFFGDNLTGTGNVFQGNTVQNGSYGVHISGTGTANLVDGWIVQNNTITNVYGYSAYLYYTSNLKFRNNTITTTSTGTHYGVYCYYGDNAIEITGNKITSTSAGTKYGINQYYSDGTSTLRGFVANNVILLGNGSNTVYGLRAQYGNFQRYYNNTVNIVSTSAANGYAAYFYYSSAASYADNEIRNNIFSNTGGGYAMYVYNPSLADNNTWDYNNLYTTGAKLVDQGTPATDYANLTASRAAFKKDMNSISYDPGFTSTTNLVPDPTNPASWSVNGRGVHLANNNKDVNGNARVTTLATGVPDIGAYEFTPTATPPAATAIPSSPAAGSIQYFLFGQDTVASIDWAANSTVPTTVTVRQYSGTIPPQMVAASPNSYMYFYTDISAATGTYDYTPSIYYKDPWLGKITSETNLKLVKKLGSGSWIPYNFTESSTNTGRNIITSPGRTTLGYFSGIDNDVLFVAKITPSSNFFCPGGSVTLTANQGTGITYKWKLNGNYITGATSMTYITSTPGNYTVEETRNSAVVESEEEPINVINPPAATISSARNVICVGGSEPLTANTGANLTYQWQFNGNDIPSATGATHIANAAGNYTLIVTNPGCSTTSQPLNVTAVPLPMATLTPDTTVMLCAGSMVTMNATVPATGLNIAYQWQLNGIDIPGANSPSYATSLGGNYTLALSSSTCPVTVSPGTNIINTPSPTPAIKNTGLTLSTGAFHSYQWYKDGAPIQGATNFSYLVTENGSYTVEVSNGGCTGMSQAFIIKNVGVDNVDKATAISIYPNPANTTVSINAPFKIDVVLTTIDGRTLYSGEDIKTVDVSQYPAGIYLMKILDADGNVIKNERILKSDK